MAYQLLTLGQFISQIGDLMGDQTNTFWTPTEISYATWEGLRVWGAYTAFYRSRGEFTTVVAGSVSPEATSPYYDLSLVIPDIRSRVYPLWRIVQEIQFMLLEAPGPVGNYPVGVLNGSNMSQQIDLSTIVTAVQLARDRFATDSRLPLSVHTNFAEQDIRNGVISYSSNTVYVHRLSWQDTYSQMWKRLFRQDAWAIDKQLPFWTLQPAPPAVYSESELNPLTLQIVPPPLNEGQLEAVTVDSFPFIDLNNPSASNPLATMNVPDEWVHAIKYAALSHILSTEGQIKDETRAAYCESRYQQALEFARQMDSVTRVLVNGIPVNLDTVTNLDRAYPDWRNYIGAPDTSAAMYDLLVFKPGLQDGKYGVGADVIQPAPLPTNSGNNPPLPTDYIQLGPEEIGYLTKYVIHILKFKCGGTDFTSSMPSYDSFMHAVDRRKAVETARIMYLQPLFGDSSREESQTPEYRSA